MGNGGNGNGKRNGNGNGHGKTAAPMLDMKVTQLTVDPLTNLPVVILKDVASEKEAVPIWIGLAEASAISSELEKVALERPMTHDLLKNIIGEVGVSVERVEVHDFRDDIFYASIYLVAPGNKTIRVDSRPSDALALALRCGARICVARKVIDDARRLDKRVAQREGEANRDDEGDVDDAIDSQIEAGILEQLDDKHFGKWKM
jgi:bifunctional DNase/RNase